MAETKEDYLKALTLRIHFWEYKLSGTIYLLEPSVRTILESTIKDLKELKRLREDI